MKRRLIYLQHILKQKESSLVRQFLKTQMVDLKPKDWGTTILKYLAHIGLKINFEEIKQMGKQKYKHLIKTKIRDQALQYLVNLKTKKIW